MLQPNMATIRFKYTFKVIALGQLLINSPSVVSDNDKIVDKTSKDHFLLKLVKTIKKLSS